MEGIEIEINEIPDDVAREMAAVGAIPGDDTTALGDRLNLAGSPAVVTKEITRDEFLERVRMAGLPIWKFRQVPERFRFWEISMD